MTLHNSNSFPQVPHVHINTTHASNAVQATAAGFVAVYERRSCIQTQKQTKMHLIQFAEKTRQQVTNGTMHPDNARALLEELGINPTYINHQIFEMLPSEDNKALQTLISYFQNKAGSRSKAPMASINRRYFQAGRSQRVEQTACVAEPMTASWRTHPDSICGNGLAALCGIIIWFTVKKLIKKIAQFVATFIKKRPTANET